MYSQKAFGEFQSVSLRILEIAKKNLPTIDFLEKFLTVLADFSCCDIIDLWLVRPDRKKSYIFARKTAGRLGFTHNYQARASWHFSAALETYVEYEQICYAFCASFVPFPGLSIHYERRDDRYRPTIFESDAVVKADHLQFKADRFFTFDTSSRYQSIDCYPVKIGDETIGLLSFIYKRKHAFKRAEIESYQTLMSTVGFVLIKQSSQSALHERIRELTCLYGFARLAELSDATLPEIFNSAVSLLPPAWQFPDIAQARIQYGTQEFKTARFHDGVHTQSCNITVNGTVRGCIEIVYTEERPLLDEGPFLAEERKLLNASARELGHLIERREALENSVKLQEQLRHADKLATIGQLAAGVAHEINEPLCSILGFAQLIQKTSPLPEQTYSDLGKIISASLHGREIVRKLLLFSRQMPARIELLDLNKVVEDGLCFLESQCVKEGIVMVKLLDPAAPQVVADRSQMTQVLLNLVVNAIQAMPGGGRLQVQTKKNDATVSLIVSDSGVGMSEEVQKKIFLPFFTTKDIGQGTGLGMAVVNGIVLSHKGVISIDSTLGKGSTITVMLPLDHTRREAEVGV
ncbi:MAG: hypothetical protein JW795_17185 [Chitinivibrionales bacterium]|nr:hypothetical protein [Chitinivibrionales bacterium]